MVNKKLVAMAESMKNETITEKKPFVILTPVVEEKIHFDFMDEEKAKESNTEILKRVGFQLDNMVRLSSQNHDVLAYTNSTFGQLNYLMGNKDIAKNIRNQIVKNIGFKKDYWIIKTNLIKTGINYNILNTQDNSEFGILEYLIGEEEKPERAEKIRNAIIDKIGFDSEGLIHFDRKSKNVCSESNISFAKFSYLMGYEEMAKRIRDTIVSKAKNYDEFVNQLDFTGRPNFAILEYLLGNKENAEEIRENRVYSFFDFSNAAIRSSCEISNWGVLQLAEKLRQIYEVRKV